MALDVDTLLSKATDSLTAGRSFGPVIERDGCVVIPAAFVVGAGGGGGGEGPPTGESSGSGSGGGYVSVSWPMGAYVVRNGEAKWVPALDVTRLAVGGLALVGTVLKLRARRRG